MAEDLPLGSWEDDRSSITATGIPDRGDVYDLPSNAQFPVHVARLVKKREQNIDAEYDHVAAFVLVSQDQYQDFKKGRKEQPLIYTGIRRLTGRIHFATSVATRSVVEEFVGDDSELFSRLASLKVDQLPTVVYVPQRSNSSLTYYPKGTYTDDRLAEIHLSVSQVTVDAIQKTIDIVHQHELVTPDNSGPSKIWSDISKRRPSSDAERRVQQFVRIGLAVKFAHDCSIREEQAGKEGTTDLEIVKSHTDQPGKVTHHALLEMKVLRSRGETGKLVSARRTKKHIEEGLSQAHVYGTKKNTMLKMLCCFDMRDEDVGDVETFSSVDAQALKVAVLLRRWFIYHDSKTYRAMQAAETPCTSP